MKNKRALQEELGLWQDDKTMMIEICVPLTDQKGFDLINYVMDELCQDNIQIVSAWYRRGALREYLPSF